MSTRHKEADPHVPFGNAIAVRESDISYGVRDPDDDLSQMMTCGCPRCGGVLRDWGTTSDLFSRGPTYFTWKCTNIHCVDPRHGGRSLFEERLTNPRISARYTRLDRAMK